MRGTRLIVALGVGFALTGGTAQAATVAVEPVGDSDQVFYRADAGESNRVVASQAGNTMTIEDLGATIVAGDDCDEVSEHVATCTIVGLHTLNAELGGRADSARIQGAALGLVGDGGPGRDRLVGGTLGDRLDGGPGADVMVGRAFIDIVSYIERADDVTVSLGDGKRNDGGRLDTRQRDRLRGIEGVVGGEGDDVLIGTGKDDQLFGQGGRDVARGMGGDDDVGGGDGNDRLYGGTGDDFNPLEDGGDIFAGGRGEDQSQGEVDGVPDVFRGGPGQDTYQHAFGVVRVSLDGRPNDGGCGDPACSFSDEGDNVASTEEVLGSQGADVLIGSGRDEIFQPSDGADTVRARGGNDTIKIGMDGDADLFDCGAGIDSVVGTADATDMNPNCEL